MKAPQAKKNQFWLLLPVDRAPRLSQCTPVPAHPILDRPCRVVAVAPYSSNWVYFMSDTTQPGMGKEEASSFTCGEGEGAGGEGVPVV